MAAEKTEENQPVSINDYGGIAGNYPGPMVAASTGFERSANGAFHEFAFSNPYDDYPTVVTGQNSSGTAVGFSSDNYFDYYASSFILDPDGYYTQFTIPENSSATIAEAINADGVITGWYNGCNHVACDRIADGGFVRSPQGVFALFTPPGAIVTLPERAPAGEESLSDLSLTAPPRMSINQAGTVTGSYTDANQAVHGFVRASDGRMTSFDPPRGRQTTATSINDSGVIAGSFYHDWDAQTAIGFLRIPAPSPALDEQE